MSVAIVIPEIGFDEVPMRPVMRDDTVAKKNAKITVRMAASTFPCSGMPGTSASTSATTSVPMSTTDIGSSRSVRAMVPPAAAPKPRMPSTAELTMVGIVRPSVISPEASTAPAPM